MHSIKMYDATDLMPRLMIIHSTADMYAARRQTVSQLRKTLDGTHAVEVLRYQSASYATMTKEERTVSDNKAITDIKYSEFLQLTRTTNANTNYAGLLGARSVVKHSRLSTPLIRAHRRCIRSFIKTQCESKATADREFEHSTEGEHQSQEASEVQSMTDTTMTQSMASTTDIMACKPKRQSTLPSTDALQDYVLQKTSTTGNVKVPYRILRLDALQQKSSSS